jgi:Flp pilus assembly protein TadB
LIAQEDRMSTLKTKEPRRTTAEAGMGDAGGTRPSGEGVRRGHRGHRRWMMIACCLPMVAIVIALVATGVVGVGLIAVALICVAMMALMMGAMSHGGGGGGAR